MKKRYIALGVIGAVLVIGMIAGKNDKPGATAGTDGSTSTPPLDLTAAQISKAFQVNEARAKLAYDGTVLRVTGTVKDIDLNIVDNPVIELRGSGEVEGMGVNSSGKLTDVDIHGLSQQDAANINKGAKMTFLCKGDVDEIMGRASLSDCAVVAK